MKLKKKLYFKVNFFLIKCRVNPNVKAKLVKSTNKDTEKKVFEKKIVKNTSDRGNCGAVVRNTDENELITPVTNKCANLYIRMQQQCQ